MKLTLAILALLCIQISSSVAASIPLRADVGSSQPKITVLKSEKDRIELEILLPDVELSEATLEGKNWERIAIPGGGWENDLGSPELPNFSAIIAIPARVGVRAEFEALESTTIPDIELMPAQGKDADELASDPSPVQFNMAAYSSDAFYSKDEVAVSEPALLRGMRVVALKTNPVSYNPVTRELRVTHRYRLNVHLEGTDLRNSPVRPMRPISPSWAKIMRSMIANYDDLNVDEINSGSYLLICENDANLVNNILAPLVDWKRREGHSVTVQTFTPGATNTTIKTMIQTAYNTWDVPPEYVLLFGDIDGDYALPAWDYSAYDHPYTQLDGTDILADVSIGRIPATDAAMSAAMVAKVLYYEKTPLINNNDWYHQGVLLAGSSSSGSSTIQVNRWIKTRMIEHEFTRIDTFWYNMSGSVVATLTTAFSNGVSFVNYRGYMGMSGWSNTNTDNLSNGRMLPFLTTLTCATGGFANESLMEHFVKVGTTTTPKGAIGCVGTATTGTHTRYNNTINYGVYAGIFDEGITQTGTSLVRGKLELWKTYQANDAGSVTNFSNWNALAGDPGIELFTGAIQFMTCDVPASVDWGVNTLTLTVNETGVGPLADATVCVFKANELQTVGLTDASGQVTLPLTVTTAGNVKVTVVKQNFAPIADSLDVIQANVVVGYLSNTVDDDNSGTSFGDGDGRINPGETVELPLVFKNFGSSTTATNIAVTAQISDLYGNLTDSVETFPNLAPGINGNSLDDFDLHVASNCPNDHVVHLSLTTTSDQGTWSGLMDLPVYSYDMSILSARAVGSDTLLSPGETADFLLTVKNIGDKDARSLTATIVSLDTNVTVNDSSAGFGTVNVGASATCSADPFNLSVPPMTIRGYLAKLVVTFTGSTGATQVDTITISLGAKMSTDPQGPDAYGYYCFDNSDIGYSQRPVYNWIEIDPDYGGQGTVLNLYDSGENQDASIVVPLPFIFRFYGEDTDRITVCSNGWISTTADASYTDFRNYPIPSSPGPRGMIAAFWDDLKFASSDEGRVYVLDDVVNHRYIIEWSRVRNLNSPTPIETFEIVLYDPAYWQTTTGDGEILFQYQAISEVYGPGDDNPYSTIGIERQDYQDGIEVVYWNMYRDPAAAPLQAGRAYFFTPDLDVGAGPPIINVSPASISLNAPHNGVASTLMSLTNVGSSVLQYSTSLTYQRDGQNVTIPGSPTGVDASGGPDAFGYTWVDSDEPSGPTYSWVDISQIGTPVTFIHNDSTSQAMPIGFEFPLYGQTFSNYYLSPNGWISLTSHVSGWTNTTLPNPEEPFNLIGGFWDDLDPLQTGADVRTWNNGSDSLVVSFLSVPHWGTSVVGTYTFQMIMTANGTVTCQYQNLVGNYQSCTVGIQNGNGTSGLQVCYDQAYLHNGLAVRFYDPLLRLQPAAGAVIPGHTNNLSVIGYAYGMQTGTYQGVIGIDSNDPVNPHVTLPVTMHVGNQPGTQLVVSVTPNNPPIVIPVNGGTFTYNGEVANHSAGTQNIDFWTMITLPDGTPYGPTIYRDNNNLYSGVSITRTLTQSVPGNSPPGQYYFYANAGFYPDTVIVSDGFSFTKSSALIMGLGADNWNVTGWDDPDQQSVPVQFAFKGCKPNPFNPTTEVLFDLPQISRVEIRIYDVMGRQVAILQDGMMQAGSHTIRWDARAAASGVYFLSFQSGDFKTTQKLLLVK
ncbi:MAG: C25 family cysteine peptidase [bacterium]|nr:C25 family cysteine peptidase [bacterium]